MCTDKNGKTTERNRVVPKPSFFATQPPCQNNNITNQQECENSWVPTRNQRADVSNPYGCEWAVNGSCVDNDGNSNCDYLNVGKPCEALNQNKETCENKYNETKCLWNSDDRSCSRDEEWLRNNMKCPHSDQEWSCGTGSPPHVNVCGYKCMKGFGPFPENTELCNPQAYNTNDYVFCEPPYNKCDPKGDPNFPQSLKCCNGRGECRLPSMLE